jgi:hypothetical protein
MLPRGRPICDPGSWLTVSGRPHESEDARCSYLDILAFLKIGTLEFRQHVFGIIGVSLDRFFHVVSDPLANTILGLLDGPDQGFRDRDMSQNERLTLKDMRGLMTSWVMESMKARRVCASLSTLSLTSDQADLRVVVSRRESKN